MTYLNVLSTIQTYSAYCHGRLKKPENTHIQETDYRPFSY